MNLASSKLDLRVELVLTKETTTIEVGDSVGLKITSPVDFKNYLVQVDFGDSSGIRTLVGDCFLFNEYSLDGPKQISIQAQSLSNPSMKFSSLLNVTVNKQVDRSPMTSVEILANQITETDVKITVLAAGGEPYSCVLAFGDSVNATFYSNGRSLRYNNSYPPSN